LESTHAQNRCIFVFEQDYQELGWHRLVLRPYLAFGRSSVAALAGLAGALSAAVQTGGKSLSKHHPIKKTGFAN